jgi:hypothetical protein
MATVIFENMIRALQEQSDAHIEALHGSLAQHNSWLSAVVADTWMILNGVGTSEPTVSISKPGAPTELSEPTQAVKANAVGQPDVSPPKPPAPLCSAVVDAFPGAKSSKFGGVCQGRPPVNKRKGTEIWLTCVLRGGCGESFGCFRSS